MPDDAADLPPSALLAMTAEIVSAYSEANAIAAEALPALIQDVHQALGSAGKAPTVIKVAQEPAVPIKRSVFPDYIVCLEDGKKLKMLKRYIGVRFGLTPDAYRAKWSLPRDYPMVAPEYRDRRSTSAKESGLGRKGTAEAEVEVRRIPEGKRGVRRKANEEVE